MLPGNLKSNHLKFYFMQKEYLDVGAMFNLLTFSIKFNKQFTVPAEGSCQASCRCPVRHHIRRHVRCHVSWTVRHKVKCHVRHHVRYHGIKGINVSRYQGLKVSYILKKSYNIHICCFQILIGIYFSNKFISNIFFLFLSIFEGRSNIKMWISRILILG